MSDVIEQFGANLVRVIKKVKRRSPDGGTQVVKQAFHVKKANPNDEYSSADGRSKVPPMPKAGSKVATATGPLLQPSPDPGESQPVEEPQAETTRMLVRYYDIPWIDKKAIVLFRR